MNEVGAPPAVAGAQDQGDNSENERLLAFLYACPVGLLEIFSDGAIDMVNPVAMQLLLKLSTSLSTNFLQATETHAPELRNLLDAFTAAQGTVCENYRIVIRTGQERRPDFEVLSCTIVKLEANRFVVSLSDVTNQVRQEQKLKEAESWFASLLEGASEFGVMSLDRQGRIASVSPSLSKQFGRSEEDLLGSDLSCFETADASRLGLNVEEELGAATREGWHLQEDWHLHGDGSRGWYQRLVAVRHDATEPDNVCGYTVVLRECQQHALDARKLKEMLTRDHLTGTYNRMHFFELAERECERRSRSRQPLSMIITDVDFFKQVNDRYGHAMGDEVLKQFAEVCLSQLRSGDSIARIGGEEFAILLPGTDLESAQQFADRLRVAIRQSRVERDGISIAITASFGCIESADQCSLPDLMASADAALYEAKRAGRDCVVARSSRKGADGTA